MILYVTSEGEARPYLEINDERIVVGPVFSYVGDRLIFSAGLSVEDILSYRIFHRQYQQKQICCGEAR